jgi:hypothetical protein
MASFAQLHRRSFDPQPTTMYGGAGKRQGIDCKTTTTTPAGLFASLQLQFLPFL